MAETLKFGLTLDTGKFVGGATQAALAAANLSKGLTKLEGSAKNPFSKGSGISAAPIIPVGGPSKDVLKSQQKEQQQAAKAAALLEKQQQKESLAALKASDKAKAAEAKAAAKTLEQEAKAEAAFQKSVTLNRLKADKLEAKEREAQAKASAKALQKANDESISGSFKNAFSSSNDAAAAFDSVGSALGAILNPVTLVTAAVVGLTAAFTGAVIGGAALAVQAAELKNDTVDALQAFLGSQQIANDVYDKIGDITDRVAISQDRATGLARELSAAGVTSADALTALGRSVFSGGLRKRGETTDL